MPSTTTTTVTTRATTGVAVHTISFRGTAGSIFICLCIAMVLFVIGFVTTEWSVKNTWHEGMWEECRCNKHTHTEDWFKAFQAMNTIGLIGLSLALILVSIYFCIHSISKNTTIIALMAICFITVLFMVIGFSIYGSKRTGLNWSFAISVISCILCFAAAILSIVQMRASGVRLTN